MPILLNYQLSKNGAVVFTKINIPGEFDKTANTITFQDEDVNNKVIYQNGLLTYYRYTDDYEIKLPIGNNQQGYIKLLLDGQKIDIIVNGNVIQYDNNQIIFTYATNTEDETNKVHIWLKDANSN